MTTLDELIEDFKKRLVEVECDCDEETKSKCLMFPDHCDGSKKEIIDVMELVNEGLNNKLLADKDKQIAELKAQIEKMKNDCLDVIQVQGINLTDDYMAGMYNGMIVVYNSCLLKSGEIKKVFCSKNESGKWEKTE